MKFRLWGLLLSVALTSSVSFAQGPPGGGPQIGGDGIWVRNAIRAEGPTFDECHAHQPGSGEYHYHANPICLRLQLDDNIQIQAGHHQEAAPPWHHSPILGWAYDGFPIYGPYGYSNPKDASSPVARIKSGFILRNLTERHTLADWSAALHHLPAQLSESQFGPTVSEKYPLGWYVEDYDYVTGYGDLDLYNGRFGVTPEFPNGTYAYFVTVDDDGEEAFPYILGRQYYGTVTPASVNTITEPVKDHFTNGNPVGPPSNDPYLASWLIKNSRQYAQVVNGHNPTVGPQTTWPTQNTPVYADIQSIRYSDDWVYLNAPGLASHIMGPWYDPASPDGVFPNFPRDQHFQVRISRRPTEAGNKTTNLLGPLGRWVNGVAVFNMLDGAGWSHALQADTFQSTAQATPVINSVAFNGRKTLTIGGNNFGAGPRVLINQTDQSRYVQSANTNTITIFGKTKVLGLKSGDNTIQTLTANGSASNVFTFKL